MAKTGHFERHTTRTVYNILVVSELTQEELAARWLVLYSRNAHDHIGVPACHDTHNPTWHRLQPSHGP